MRPSVPRRTALLAALLASLQFGCGSLSRVPDQLGPDAQRRLGNVGLVTSAKSPEVDISGFAHGKWNGAARGAGATLSGCMQGLAGGGCGSDCGLLVVLWSAVCVAATPVGAVVGAAVAPAAGQVQANEQVLHGAIDAAAIQRSLQQQVADAAGRSGLQLAPPGAAGVDTELEAALVSMGVSGTGVDPPLTLRMRAHVTLTRTSDRAVLMARDFEYAGDSRRLEQWAERGGEDLLAGLRAGYESLGTQIVEQTLLLQPLPDRMIHFSGFFREHFGLAPIEPPLAGGKVAGQQPRLQWEPFPRDSDRAKAPDAMARVADVRYDLLIARDCSAHPAVIEYERRGLPEAAHQVQTPLAPATRHCWAVRARYAVDGREYVTEWSARTYQAMGSAAPMLGAAYEFDTP